MSKVIIVGNSVAAEILYGYIKNDERYNVGCFAVDKPYITETFKFDLEVVNLDELEHFFPSEDYKVMLGIGYNNINQNRANIFDRIKSMGYEIESYIHPSAVVSSTSKLGEGTLVMSNSVVEPYATIGHNTIVWSNCTIAHHSELGSHCWIASNSIISGQAKVKDFTFIGVNCTIVNEVLVEELNIIGAGSLITKNTKPKDVYLTRSSEKHRFDSINYSKFFLK